jgi:hypothetical protein
LPFSHGSAFTDGERWLRATVCFDEEYDSH